MLGDSEAVALLRFRRRSAVPPALAQQVAAVAVRRWRESQRQQVAEEHAAEEAVTMAGQFPTSPMVHLTPGRYLASPDVWIGLAVTALLLAVAARLRRYRSPI